MINNKFKNSVFTTLFADPDVLRELYCALEDITLPPDTAVSINTLEDVLFMDLYNDISFEIDGKLVVLIEHQSTINPNMALRLLMYIGRVYEKIVEGRNIYSSKLLPVPRPEFFVLYNGTDPFPDEKTIHLSDTFEGLPSFEKPIPSLELEVRVININEGRNSQIAQRCRKLAEYSAFIAKVREFEKELGDRTDAFKKAVKYCQKHDILKEFMELHATEVLSMLMTEWNWDDALAVRYEEGMEKGLEQGMEVGIERGREQGLNQGREEGLEQGIDQGRTAEKLIIARNLLAEGSTPEFVQKITGLSPDEIAKL